MFSINLIFDDHELSVVEHQRSVVGYKIYLFIIYKYSQSIHIFRFNFLLCILRIWQSKYLIKFDLRFFLQAAAVIGRNKSHSFFQPIIVAVGKNK